MLTYFHHELISTTFDHLAKKTAYSEDFSRRVTKIESQQQQQQQQRRRQLQQQQCQRRQQQ